MAHPPPIGPALERLNRAIESLEQSLLAAGPVVPGEHPAISKQFNDLEQGLKKVIAELATALGQDQKSQETSQNG